MIMIVKGIYNSVTKIAAFYTYVTHEQILLWWNLPLSWHLHLRQNLQNNKSCKIWYNAIFRIRLQGNKVTVPILLFIFLSPHTVHLKKSFILEAVQRKMLVWMFKVFLVNSCIIIFFKSVFFETLSNSRAQETFNPQSSYAYKLTLDATHCLQSSVHPKQPMYFTVSDILYMFICVFSIK